MCVALLRAIRARMRHVKVDMFDALAFKLCKEGRLDRLEKICASVAESPYPRCVGAALGAVSAADSDDKNRLLDVAVDAYAKQHQVRTTLMGNAWVDSVAVLMASLPVAMALSASTVPSWWMWALAMVALLAALNTARLRQALLAHDANAATSVLEAIVAAKLNPSNPAKGRSDGVYRTAAPALDDLPLPTRSIRVTRDDQQVARYPLEDEGVVKIGRLESAQITLDDSSVSRLHAVLELSGGEVEVIDLGSDTGTYVNGERVNKRDLSDGDKLYVGDFVLELLPPGASPELLSPVAPDAPHWSCSQCAGTTFTPVKLPDELAKTLTARACDDCFDVSWTTRK